MRNDQWLTERMNQVWRDSFSDVERKNSVIISFKGRWKNKFGHIKLAKKKSKNLFPGDTEIAINGFFKNEIVPEYVIDVTIAHELVHYTHGFSSPYKRCFRYPHYGGVVNRELKARGFREMIKKEKHWVKTEWKEIIGAEFRNTARRNYAKHSGNSIKLASLFRFKF